ncbi:MAG TPA: HEAT repeat domain-containing protein [Nitrospirales bacterium]|jgi:HEAT repeat protein
MSDRVLEEIAALKDEDWALREDAATLLGQFADPRAVQPLIEVLHDEDRAVREAATTALRKIGRAGLAALTLALEDPNANVQEAAISILKDFAEASTVEPLVKCLTSTNWILRMHAAKALGTIADERAVRPLIPLLMDPVKAVRVDTTEALARLGRAALESVLAALNHDQWMLRLHACEALGKMGGEEAIEPLCRVMQNDRDAAVRQDAAKALGGIGHPRALEALTGALQDLDVRPFAVEALGKLKDKGAVPALIEIVTGAGRPANSRKVPSCGDESGEIYLEEMEVQEQAIGALADIGDERAIEPMIGALKDTRLRSAAAAALGRFGLRVADPLLAKMKSETDSNILYHARAILTSVGWRPRANMKAGI